MGVIDNVKEVADLVQKMGNVDLYRKIMTLEEEIFQLTRQLREMVLKNEQLEETLMLKEKLEFRPPFYFAKGDRIPYCQRCWEAEKLAVHMLDVASGKRFDCPKCKLMVVPDSGSDDSEPAWALRTESPPV